MSLNLSVVGRWCCLLLILGGACHSQGDMKEGEGATPGPARSAAEADESPAAAAHSDQPASRKAAWKARLRVVHAEIEAGSDHPWAGIYSYNIEPDGGSLTLSLAPGAGFVYERSRIYGNSKSFHGTVAETPAGLTLSVESGPHQDKEWRVVPIKWGQRRYLIEPDELAEFCNAVLKEREPRKDSWGFYLLRDGDGARPVQGVPRVPEPYNAFFRDQPMVTEIIALGDLIKPEEEDLFGEEYGLAPGFESHENRMEVTLNKGRDAGVLPQMVFHFEGESFTSEAIVKAVADTTATAIIEYYDDADDEKPALGWILQTLATPTALR